MKNNLSLQARGALDYFQNNPDVEITPQVVTTIGKRCGIVVARRILNELIEEGFMIRHHNRDEDGGYVPVRHELTRIAYAENSDFANI